MSDSRSSVFPHRIIGLTGGIGMGKTTVSNYLAQTHHLPILDADVYARQAVQAGSPILATIAARYGANILLPDNTLDRRQLGNIVFNQPSERLWLEQQIHPYVRQAMDQDRDRLIHQLNPATLVMVIPLLFEAQLTHLVTEIWVVYCAPEQQIARLQQREHLDLAQIQARINSQMPIQAKLDRADIQLNNDSTPTALLQQVDRALANWPITIPT
jgi:dephospho-CoA kinase